MRGLMIDCSRCCEQPGYYHHLIDLLATLGQDTLVLHFCDDQGLGVKLPGFEAAAHPWALDVPTVQGLLAHARERGLRVIPEVETFGHTRWVADLPEYAACFPGEAQPAVLGFNAIDPRHPRVGAWLDALLDATCALFDDPVVHIGCDEVDLTAGCDIAEEDQADVWADHVNRVIAAVHARDRTPMLWADHLESDARIAAAVDRRVIAVSWHYEPEADESGLLRLRDVGYKDLVLGPSASCWRTHSHTHVGNEQNMARYAAAAQTHGVGFLNTVWCPMRHVQRAVDLGIAFGALCASDARHIEDADTRTAALADLLFGSDAAPARAMCAGLPDVAFTCDMAHHLATGAGPDALVPPARARAERTVACAHELRSAIDGWRPDEPAMVERWEACRLAARTAELAARLCLAPRDVRGADRDAVIRDLDEDWMRTRDPADPARTKARWGQHVMHLRALLAGVTLPG